MQHQCTPRAERACEAPGCNVILTRRPGEKPVRFRERKTCSRACRYRLAAQSHRASTPPEWQCPRCGERFPRRTDGRMAPYCQRCQAIYMRERYQPHPRQSYVAQPGHKRCCGCKTEKLLGEFNRNASRPDGLQQLCRSCQAASAARSNAKHVDRIRAYREQNREKINARSAAWSRANPKRRRAIARRYYLRHRDEIRAYFRDFYQAHKDRYKAYQQANRERLRELERLRRQKNIDAVRIRRRQDQATRNARKRGNAVGTVDYAAILRRDGRHCHICDQGIAEDESLHFDHVIPLARGGEHSMANIRVAHGSCNVRKGASLL